LALRWLSWVGVNDFSMSGEVKTGILYALPHPAHLVPPLSLDQEMLTTQVFGRIAVDANVGDRQMVGPSLVTVGPNAQALPGLGSGSLSDSAAVPRIGTLS